MTFLLQHPQGECICINFYEGHTSSWCKTRESAKRTYLENPNTPFGWPVSTRNSSSEILQYFKTRKFKILEVDNIDFSQLTYTQQKAYLIQHYPEYEI